jgi:ribonuclease HII
MIIYAGIDEAGYGPMFGPLVVARSVFRVEPHEPADRLPSLWALMKSVVCKQPSDKKRRIAVNDSKVLYSPSFGIGHLERGVLGPLYASGIQPRRLDDLLEQIGLDEQSRPFRQPWYVDSTGGPSLPVCVPRSQLSHDQARFARGSSHAGISMIDAGAAVVFEDRFNRIVRSLGSKAACSWIFVGEHLQTLWGRLGQFHPRVVIDRQGGRRNYGELLASLFPRAHVRVLDETSLFSRYNIVAVDRSMSVAVRINSERYHFPVAYASMTAKYIRELLMMRFQRFWQVHAPKVKATYGYFGDGKRFLAEIEPVIEALRIDRTELIRRC